MMINKDYMAVMRSGRGPSKAIFRKQQESAFHVVAAMFLGLFLLLISSCETVYAEVDLDAYADAIYIAEGKEKAVVPYGMFFKGCDWDNVDYCRKIVKNTVFNTLVKYRSTRCKEGEGDIDCLARRYCPLDDPRDTKGLNKYWKKNVEKFLEK